ncbi:hypothetical protein cyc_08761 [Cyclospora cayetanensis]|uniref:Uncharacterized protein n=1 Tax=Cyclospora cayetanensis TaxID=88456 RepID=A0A1D3CSF1_9EIME|nr:hypothetical protein cyc_08761 [Cyclospora cayetanensis]
MLGLLGDTSEGDTLSAAEASSPVPAVACAGGAGASALLECVCSSAPTSPHAPVGERDEAVKTPLAFSAARSVEWAAVAAAPAAVGTVAVGAAASFFAESADAETSAATETASAASADACFLSAIKALRACSARCSTTRIAQSRDAF